MQSSEVDYARQLGDATFFRGRVALAAILRAMGIVRGDEVVVQAFTCIAVPEAVLSVGARPVYADVAAGSVNMDAATLDAAITPRTKAIVVQHTFGIPAAMPGIVDLARARGLPLVEDCAHALGSSIAGQSVGTFGRAAFFSYEAGKPLVLGLGGSAVSVEAPMRDALAAASAAAEEPGRGLQMQIAAMRLAYRMTYRPETYWWVRDTFRLVSKLGLVRGNYTYTFDEAAPSPDFRRRMGAIQRDALRQALPSLPALLRHRERVSDLYRREITGTAVHHVPLPAGGHAVHGRYPLLCDDKPGVLAAARSARVELAEFYSTPVHPLTGDSLAAVGYRAGECANAEATARRIVTLPTNEYVSDAFIRRAARCLNAT